MSGEAKPQPARPRVSTLWPPAYAKERVEIIWSREGDPVGLCVDGRYYAVRLSPGLRHKAGYQLQTIFEVRS